MSRALIHFPATITLDRTADGRFRAKIHARVIAQSDSDPSELILDQLKWAAGQPSMTFDFSDDVVEAETVAALFDALKEKVVPPEETDEDDPGGPDFDADLNEVLTKNAELYRRLAQ